MNCENLDGQCAKSWCNCDEVRRRSAKPADLVMLIRRLCHAVGKQDPQNTVREQALDYLERHGFGGSPLKKEEPLAIPRPDVEAAIKDAEARARAAGRTQYVGAIGWPEGSQIYGDATLSFTDDRELLTGLGTLFATCEPDKTTRHL